MHHSYLTADHLGSPRIITGNNGEVISRHDYMAFGADISETLGNVGNRTTAQGYNKPDEIRKQYTGYEHDDESGLDFAQARYYNSSHGRFTSVDPLTASANTKDPQTFNRYTYAMNSPYKFTDPLGLISESSNDKPINIVEPCDFACRMKNGSITKMDRELASFHIQNGTALGYAFLNAIESRQQSQNTSNTSNNETSNNTESNNLQSDAVSHELSHTRKEVSESENSGTNESSESQSDSLGEIFNDFRLRFAKGGNLPLNGTGVISEEIKGLLPALYKVTLETYRLGRKYSKKGRKNQNKADELFNLASNFIITQSNYIGGKFDSPRYLVADGKKISYSQFELTSYVQNKLQTAFKLGVRDERKRGILLTKR